MLKQKRSVGEYSFAVSINLVCSLMVFLYNILIRQAITPYEMGIYTSVNLVITYLGYAQAGVLNSFNRDYPQMLGSGKQQASHLRDTAFSYICLVYCIITLLCVIVSVCGVDNELMGKGLLFAGLISGGNALYTFFDFSLKSNRKFLYSAWVTFFKTVAQIITGLVCIYIWGYIGIYIGLVSAIVVTLILNVSEIKSIRISKDISLVKKMLTSGFMLLANSVVWTVMQSVDKFVILHFMDMESLGVYSVALMGFSTMVLIPQSLSQIFYVKMSRLYGKNHDIKELINQAIHFTSIIGCLTAAFVAIAYFALPVFINLFMPMYVDCIRSTQYIVLGVAIYGTTLLFGNVLSILRKNIKLIITTILLCIVNLVLSSSFVIFYRRSIESVAIGTSLSYTIYAILILKVSLQEYGSKLRKVIGRTILPVLIVCMVLLLLGTTGLNDYMALGISLFIALAEILLWNYKMLNRLMNQVMREKNEE